MPNAASKEEAGMIPTLATNPSGATGAAAVLAAAAVITLVLVCGAFGYKIPDTAQQIYGAALTYLFSRYLHDSSGEITQGFNAALMAEPPTAEVVPPAPPNRIAPVLPREVGAHDGTVIPPKPVAA